MASPLGELPPELVGCIVKFLPVDAFRNLRLVSRSMAMVTRTFLALDMFVGLPWKRDAQRLLELSRLEECRGKIRVVDLYFGRLDERMVLYHEDDGLYSELEPAERQLMLRKHWLHYYDTQREAKRNGPFDMSAFGASLANLTSLEDLCLTWSQCPYKEPHIKDLFDPDDSVALTRETMLDIQQMTLDTLWKLDLPLRSLTIEPMVLHDLTLPSGPPPQKLFSHLEHFHVELVAELFLSDRLEYLLAMMSNLTRLCIQFIGEESARLDPVFLPKTRIPHLKGLSLVCVEFSLDSFADFLRLHSGTLEDLNLIGAKGIPGEDGMPSRLDWDDMFRFIRSELKKLKSVTIEGTFERKRGPSITFYKEDDIRYKNGPPNSSHILSQVIEDWIIKGGDYPDLPWDHSRWGLDHEYVAVLADPSSDDTEESID